MVKGGSRESLQPKALTVSHHEYWVEAGPHILTHETGGFNEEMEVEKGRVVFALSVGNLQARIKMK
jgi:hypothetical protein